MQGFVAEDRAGETLVTAAKAVRRNETYFPARRQDFALVCLDPTDTCEESRDIARVPSNKAYVVA
jgi:hypothetical protein